MMMTRMNKELLDFSNFNVELTGTFPSLSTLSLNWYAMAYQWGGEMDTREFGLIDLCVCVRIWLCHPWLCHLVFFVFFVFLFSIYFSCTLLRL